METFASMLELQAVLLVYLAVGALCKRLGIIGGEGERTLNDLVVNVCMPCLIFNSFKDITSEVLVQALAALGVSCAMCALAWVLGRIIWRRCPAPTQGPLRYGTMISNCGFAGLPLAEQTFGSVGLIYASVYLIPIRFFMWTAGVTMLSGERRPAGEVARKIATNPCVIAVFVGLARGLLAVELPEFADTALSGIASAVSPLSMMLVGAIAADADPRTTLEPTVLAFCGVRLVLMPLVSLGLCTLLGLDATITGTCLLMAAMPAAATTTLLSAQYGADAAFAAKLVSLSTALSIVTTPVLMLLL